MVVPGPTQQPSKHLPEIPVSLPIAGFPDSYQVRHHGQLRLRRRTCKACEHRVDDKCGLISQKGKAGVLEHARGLPNKDAWCPLDEPKFGPVVEPTSRDGADLYITTKQLVEDTQSLFEIVFSSVPSIKGIIGIPRSGMIVASILAAKSGLPLYRVNESGVFNVGSGMRLKSAKKPSLSDGQFLLVDDSCNRGKSMRDAKALCGEIETITACVYAHPKAIAEIDLCAVELKNQHYFEWHLFGSSVLKTWNFAVDFDGILCRDCEASEDDGAARYDRFLKTVAPKVVPRPVVIPAIITARLERYRPQTEAWLARHGIKYGTLVMGPWENRYVRTTKTVAKWKADQCRRLGITHFIESDKMQSMLISERAAIPVICPPSEQVFRPKSLVDLSQIDEAPLANQSDLAVITLAAGKRSQLLLKYTGPQMQKYAKRIGADFHAITDDLYPQYKLANKFRLLHLCKNYRRVIFLDADVWVKDHADNLFELIPEGTVGIHDDWPKIPTEGQQTWVQDIGNQTARQQGIEPIPIRTLNSGVVVFDRAYLFIWTAPPLPCKPEHLTEQAWVELTMIRNNVLVTRLDSKYNAQWWFADFADLEPIAHFVHFANCPHDERIERLKRYQAGVKHEASV